MKTKTLSLLAALLLSSMFLASCGSNGYVENADCDLNMKMIYVEGGSFQMGGTAEQGKDAERNERPVHKVTLDSYYIAECEVTQAQWQKIMGNNPAHFKGANNPVECVGWKKVEEFCVKLSRMTGKTYILPTEAQWEYAARGGQKSQGYKYSGGSIADEVAWTSDNGGRKTHAVKQKKPNELGLYDMSGNVFEFCSDWFRDDYYASSPELNPTGPSSSRFRIMRGGCWGVPPLQARVSCRWGISTRYCDSFAGFRVVCIPDKK